MSKIAVIGIVGESVFLPVKRFHQGEETVVATAIHREWGGKGYNQALAAARHGASVSFLGAVNACEASAITQYSRQNGIHATLSLKNEASPYAVILTDESGANHVTVCQGARLSSDDVRSFACEIASSDILLLSNETDTGVNDEAMRLAKAHGVRVIYNPAPARPLSPAVLDGVTLFTPNEHETKGLEDKANVVITLGKKGCLIRKSGEMLPPFPVGQAVDTTGAGDTFNGVLSVALAEGKSLREACRMANAAASIEVTQRYVANAIPFRHQTENILWENT